MGKAAERRKAYRMKLLTRLSFEDPDRFDLEWEVRLQSWLDEVRDYDADSLRAGQKAFGIIEEAFRVLRECEPSIYSKYVERTYDLLSHACCRRVSQVIDPRLYRLSNMGRLVYRS